MSTPQKSIKKNVCHKIDHREEIAEMSSEISRPPNTTRTGKFDCKTIPLKELSIVIEKMDINAKNDSDEGSQPRRGNRLRKKPKTYLESEHVESPRKRTSRQSSRMAQAVVTDTSEDEFEVNMNSPKKPTALFSNEDVEGQNMFGFRVSATNSKAQKDKKAKRLDLSLQNHSPGLNTPHKLLSKQLQPAENTPKHVNAIMKKRITKQVESDHEDSDFSASSSDDYVPEDDSSFTDTQREDDQNSSASDQELAKEKVPGRHIKCATPGLRGISKKDDDYFIHSEDYFLMHNNKKNLTSDHTLQRIKNLQILDEGTIEQDVSTKSHHQSCIQRLSDIHKSLFDKWLYVLGEDYNILLYGVGSKREILESFQKKKLEDNPCIVVNGFFPSLTIRSIVDSILTDMFEVHHVPTNPMEAISIIDHQLSYHNVELFVLVHNLDGAMLRNNKAQKFLSQLARIKRVHMLASVDHINAALICDHSKLSSFKFTWWDATTLLPYAAETSYETSLMVQGNGALALSSLRSVYRSLTSNAKGIYIILVKKQLDNTKTPHYQGLPFKDLYALSREAFLVSSDIALRAQLTEFLDHKLVRIKRSMDGIENLLIPIENVLLQQFLETTDP